MLDVAKIKEMFPVLQEEKKLVYLDSAASSLKPQCVIDSINYYYSKLGVNVHRGVYKLSYEATNLYEDARNVVSKFINAQFNEVVFTRGTSNALNIIASSLGYDYINEGDEVITTELEHHSSHLPWFKICERKKGKIIYMPLTSEGRITVENFKKTITPKTKVVAITYVSNVMGYITPIKEIIKIAKEHNIIVIVDAAQALPHMKVDVKDLDCDFLAFSGHKMCGPTGIGVLYGKKHLLDKMEPIEFGGDMAHHVDKDKLTYKDAPYKFETGTPLISEAIGLAAACNFLDSIGLDNIANHEKVLKDKCIDLLSEITGITVYNKTTESGVIAFNIDGVHPHDAASVFDKNDICLRAGHHCAQLISKFLGVESTLRISFYIYNDEEDVLKFVESVKEAIEFFKEFR